MKFHVTKSYLDMARCPLGTSMYGDEDKTAGEDAMFSILSCTYVFSYMALTAFCASHLHTFWRNKSGALREKYAQCASFEELMAGPLKELKESLKELCDQLNIEPLHSAKASTWRELNELLKSYRDYFVHPNPETFHDHIEATGHTEWEFPSRVASEIIEYFFVACNKPVPTWVNQTGLRSKGFEVICI